MTELEKLIDKWENSAIELNDAERLVNLLLKERLQTRTALKQIAKWHGEFPGNASYEKGTSISYEAAFGSDGERDFMRTVAQVALDDKI